MMVDLARERMNERAMNVSLLLSERVDDEARQGKARQEMQKEIPIGSWTRCCSIDR